MWLVLIYNEKEAKNLQIINLRNIDFADISE